MTTQEPLARWDSPNPGADVVCVNTLKNGAVYAELKRADGTTILRIAVPDCRITSLRVYGEALQPEEYPP